MQECKGSCLLYRLYSGYAPQQTGRLLKHHICAASYLTHMLDNTVTSIQWHTLQPRWHASFAHVACCLHSRCCHSHTHTPTAAECVKCNWCFFPHTKPLNLVSDPVPSSLSQSSQKQASGEGDLRGLWALWEIISGIRCQKEKKKKTRPFPNRVRGQGDAGQTPLETHWEAHRQNSCPEEQKH